MELKEWYLKCMRQYVDFRGRARRREYWMFVLANFIIGIVLGILESIIGSKGIIGVIYSLAILIPSLAVGVRRLHDIGKSGWFYFICLIPVIGSIWLLVLFIQDSQPGVNKWGENPKTAGNN